MATMPAAATQHHVNGAAVSPVSTLPDISGQMLTLTPAMAGELLKHRPRNRPITKSRVRAMIDDLRAHRWRPNGEPIILDQDGLLLDGQHRCQAVVESGIAIQTLVVIGVDPGDMDSIDQGQRRNGSDHLSMHDFSNTGTLAATARWLWRLERGTMRERAIGLRDHELPAYVAARPSLPVSLPWGRKVRDLLPQSLASALYHLLAQKDRALAERYFVDLDAGVNLSQDHPAHRVRDRLLKDRSPRNHAGVVARAAFVTLGWNTLRGGKPYSPNFEWRGMKDPAVPFPSIL